MPLPADYLVAGPLIMERLRNQITELRSVLPLAEVARLNANAIAGPLAYVMYDGDDVVEGEGRARQGASQLVRQRWMVVLGIRSAAQREAASHEAAGPLISRVIAALAGWTCEPFRSPLYRVAAPRVDYGANFALYPLMFAGELMTS